MADVLLGAMISGTFVLVGILVSSRSDHRKWLREQRFNYWAALAGIGHRGLLNATAEDPEELDLSGEALAVMGRVELLGPKPVVSAAYNLVGALDSLGRGGGADEWAAVFGTAVSVHHEFIVVSNTYLEKPGWYGRRRAGGPLRFAPGPGEDSAGGATRSPASAPS